MILRRRPGRRMIRLSWNTGERAAMRHLLAGLAITVMLSGCGVPPAVTVATTVADGFTNAVSGKGMTDHALSAVTTSDCALIRALDSREICTGYAGEEVPMVLMMSATGVSSWSGGPGTTAGGETADAASTELLSVQSVEALAPNRSSRVVSVTKVTVLGSYREHINAEQARERLASLKPRIITVDSQKGRMYRVVSDVSVLEAVSVGVRDAWQVRYGTQIATTF